MATNISNANPLVLTVDENVKIRPIFKQVAINEAEPVVQTVGVETPILVEATWRDCVSGELRTGMPPTDYVQVTYQGAGGGTCWEPRAVIGFEPNLNEVLRFDWRRGTDALPEAKSFIMTNPTSTTFAVKIGTNDDIVVSPSTFNIAPRSSQVVTIKATPELFNKLGDGISTIPFKVDIVEVI